MKKKVRIVTIVSYNLGNRLQNLALTRVLQNMGADVKTIPVDKNYKKRKMVVMVAKRLLGKPNNWEKFEIKIPYDRHLAEEIDVNKIDYFVAGSDQIWNPYFPFISKREFLSFAKPEQRVSYAASIGVTDFPEDKRKEFGPELEKFKSISVREETAIEIVKDISGRSAELVLDPVMLLTAEDWNKEINKKTKKQKKYMAVYFLGDSNNVCVKEIIKYAKERELEIVDVVKENKERKGSIGPLEFAGIIRDADYLLTDSFHGTVLSIIFHTPFVVVNREQESGVDMSSRIITLLKMVKMENRFVREASELSVLDEEFDFTASDKLVDENRKKSLDYLSVALS